MSIENNAAKQQIVRGWIGLFLVRLAVPVWIFIGAYSKLEGATPKSLPRSILDAGGVFGFTDHYLLLSILVAIEFIFIATMLFIPKLARLATVVLLGMFLCVLSVEMFVYGNYRELRLLRRKISRTYDYVCYRLCVTSWRSFVQAKTMLFRIKQSSNQLQRCDCLCTRQYFLYV